MIPYHKKKHLEDFYTDKFMEHTLLFEGTVNVPSRQSGKIATVELLDDISNYDYLLVERTYSEVCQMQPIRKRDDGLDTCRFYFTTVSDWGVENVNMYSLWIQRGGTNKIAILFNTSTVIQTDGNINIDLNYTLQPITKIVGVKLTERTYTERVLKQTMLDFCYPIGTYYETSNTNYDPNIELGGTWVEDTKGLTTVGAYKATEADPGSSRTYLHLGSIYGESNHILSIDEMPRHRFGVGSRANGEQNAIAASGNMIGREFLGSSIYNSYYTEFLGSDQAHNNVQPSIGVIRWHRIA